MTFLRRLTFFIVVITVFVIALLLAADNSDEVALSFLDYQTPIWPISWWMLLAFVVGVLFGNLLNLASNTRLRMDARRANKVAEGRTRERDQAMAERTPENKDNG